MFRKKHKFFPYLFIYSHFFYPCYCQWFCVWLIFQCLVCMFIDIYSLNKIMLYILLRNFDNLMICLEDHPTPVLLPGKSHGRRSLVACSGPQSMGSHRVGHDWVTSLSLFTFIHWRRKWQPTPVFLPGESQGWGSLVGCCLWGRIESDTTEVT